MDTLKNVSRMFGQLLVAGLTAATAAGFFARADPWFDLLASFPHVYAPCALVLAILLYVPSRRTAAVAALVFVLNVVPLVRFAPVKSTCEPDFSALTINAWNHLSDHDALVARLETDKPELLWICQSDPNLMAKVQKLYPHHVYDDKHREVVLFSTFPIRESHHRLSKIGRPHIEAVVETPRGLLRVFGVHAHAPYVRRLSDDRDESLSRIAADARASSEPVLVFGDLNVTMFSPHYMLLEDAGLTNARVGRGLAATWPSDWHFRVPIDHVLVSDALETCDITVGPTFASDHLPYEAFLRWR